MAYPSDCVVLDFDALVHARLGSGRKELEVLQAKSFRLPAAPFSSAVVTPELSNEAALTEVLRRMRMETGSWDKVSLLLPDSWFRINIIELASLPDRANEADQIIRWSLKRTMPLDPSVLRVTWLVLAKAPQVKVLAVSAVEKTLAAIERAFTGAGIEPILIEPTGLNIWNAVAVREPTTTRDRVFMYVRDTDFTTAVFRGPQPLFIRSRNLSPERTPEQGIRQRREVASLQDRHQTDQRRHRPARSADGGRAAPGGGCQCPRGQDRSETTGHADRVRERAARPARLLVERAARPAGARPAERRAHRGRRSTLRQDRSRTPAAPVSRQEQQQHGADDRGLQPRSALRQSFPQYRRVGRQGIAVRARRRLPPDDRQGGGMIWREKRVWLIVLGLMLAADVFVFVTYRVQVQKRIEDVDARRAHADAP